MATASEIPTEQMQEKGLKTGTLGLISSTVIATASVAPAYSLAATLAFIVAAFLASDGRPRNSFPSLESPIDKTAQSKRITSSARPPIIAIGLDLIA